MLDHAADERGVADRELRQRLHVWARNRESPPVGRTTECPAGQCRMHHAACSACMHCLPHALPARTSTSHASRGSVDAESRALCGERARAAPLG